MKSPEPQCLVSYEYHVVLKRVLGWRVRKDYKRGGGCQGNRTYKDGKIILVNQKTGRVRYISVGLVRGKDTGKSVVNFQCLQDLRWKFLHGLSRNK